MRTTGRPVTADGLIYRLAVTPVVHDLSLAGTLGKALSIQVPVFHHPTSIVATALPMGLTLDPVTGIISGTPTAAGTTTGTITAGNALGQTTAELTFTITPPIPVITSGPLQYGKVGTPYTYQITAANDPVSFNATGLPTGLTVDPATGLISGTPSESGAFAVGLSATNATGTGTAALTLTVAEVTPVATVGDGEAVEGGESGKVAVRRTGDLSVALTVRYKVKGNVVNKDTTETLQEVTYSVSPLPVWNAPPHRQLKNAVYNR